MSLALIQRLECEVGWLLYVRENKSEVRASGLTVKEGWSQNLEFGTPRGTTIRPALTQYNHSTKLATMVSSNVPRPPCPVVIIPPLRLFLCNLI